MILSDPSGKTESMSNRIPVISRYSSAGNHTAGRRIARTLVLFLLFSGILSGCGSSEAKADSILQVTLVGGDSLEAEKSTLADDYRKAAGYANDETLTVDTSLYYDKDDSDQRSASSLQILAAEFLSGEIDAFVAEQDLFEKENENHAFLNLEDILPESVLEEYSSSLIYSTAGSDGGTYPTGIILENTRLTDNKIYSPDQTIVAGIGSQSAYPQDAGNFILYLLTGHADTLSQED